MSLPSRVAPGKTFNRWTAIHFVSSQANKTNPKWLFKCICGNEKIVAAGSVVSGGSKSCGCLRTEMLATVKAGDKFNRLTAGRMAEKGGYWHFKCTCGNDHVAKLYEVRAGQIKSCGCLRGETQFPPIKIGDSFGHLTAVRFIVDSASWVFKCACGIECSPRAHRVRAGRIKTCGCNVYCQNSETKSDIEIKSEIIRLRKRGNKQTRLTNMLSSIKVSARNRGLSFSLLRSDIEALAEKQNWTCAMTGIALDVGTTKGSQPFRPSVDRIDSKRGYDVENIQLVCLMYNIAKNQFNDSDVLTFAHALVEHQQNPTINRPRLRVVK